MATDVDRVPLGALPAPAFSRRCGQTSGRSRRQRRAAGFGFDAVPSEPGYRILDGLQQRELGVELH
ncbi:MAG: hypothetical protein ACRDTV_27230, partial [Mycobacterium sp.]